MTEKKALELDNLGPEEFLKKNLDLINDENNDIQVCDCCGDGESWYGVPGEHYNREDPRGPGGPYSYNGGLCECN